MAIQEQIATVKGIVPRAVNFLTEVRSELGRVHWPTRQETYVATVVVLVAVTIVSLYLGLVDALLTQAVQLVLS